MAAFYDYLKQAREANAGSRAAWMTRPLRPWPWRCFEKSATVDGGNPYPDGICGQTGSA